MLYYCRHFERGQAPFFCFFFFFFFFLVSARLLLHTMVPSLLSWSPPYPLFAWTKQVAPCFNLVGAVSSRCCHVLAICTRKCSGVSHHLQFCRMAPRNIAIRFLFFSLLLIHLAYSSRHSSCHRITFRTTAIKGALVLFF